MYVIQSKYMTFINCKKSYNNDGHCIIPSENYIYMALIVRHQELIYDVYKYKTGATIIFQWRLYYVIKCITTTSSNFDRRRSYIFYDVYCMSSIF